MSLNLSLKFPPYSNIRTILRFSCVDPSSNRQLCNIKSVLITSIGRNIDGLNNEYKKNILQPVYFRSIPGMIFYNDSVNFDLGIITNTSKFQIMFVF